MLTKEQFMQSVRHETAICKHLYGKIPEGALDYRPTEGQRSLSELLQYLTSTGTAPMKGLIANDWSQIQSDMEKAKEVAVEDFCNAMDRQADEMEKMLNAIPDADLQGKNTTFPTGDDAGPLGQALVGFPLKFLAAYRMQLFLYLKSVGVSEISTFNCWFGMDAPQG